jgi:hypothetical protein
MDNVNLFVSAREVDAGDLCIEAGARAFPTLAPPFCSQHRLNNTFHWQRISLLHPMQQT